ncbi:hypothetical protein BV898_16108 [Hypsibius exemplaris]|uniref:Uncharacterized protein n=1 Tax=Hypsibius exemplaris TaxID=2072580 RepID=A0A9X6RL62_HYPEX|nr:hypothetical protein BV898_16108 [Hypsibius exemplaris]
MCVVHPPTDRGGQPRQLSTEDRIPQRARMHREDTEDDETAGAVASPSSKNLLRAQRRTFSVLSEGPSPCSAKNLLPAQRRTFSGDGARARLHWRPPRGDRHVTTAWSEKRGDDARPGAANEMKGGTRAERNA